jgi:hypothetical protein
MELELYLDLFSFSMGVLSGGGLFGFGLLVGLLVNRDTFTRQVQDEEYDPDEETPDEAFFEDQWNSETEFPSDGVLEELDKLHRHSTF